MSSSQAIGKIDTLLLGRDSVCHWVFTGNTVSRHHCKIKVNKDNVLLIDVGSKNGTFVNNIRLKPNGEARLNPNDSIRLGESISLSFYQVLDKILEVNSTQPINNLSQITVGSNDANDVVFPPSPHDKIVLTIIGGHCCARNADDASKDVYCGTNYYDRSQYVPAGGDVFGLEAKIIQEIISRQNNPEGEKVALVVHLLEDGVTCIGRDFTSDVRLTDHLASRRHAVLTSANNQIFIDDLQSRNGTYVNGQKIKQRTKLEEQDAIRIGTVGLSILNNKYLIGEKDQIHTSKSEARVFVNHVSYVAQSNDKGSKQLLFDVCLSINSGELVGIMGQSGSGKTTLLRIITGIYQPTAGNVVILNAEHHDNSKGKITNDSLGFVPCDDIIHSDLTVYEALHYNYLIRTQGYSKEQIDDEILSLINKLQLADNKGEQSISKQLIGDADRGGISTGQKKRVQLAMELIGMPSVLLVDEPTSGLSSEDAVIVMDILKSMAVNGSSIVCTLHQPNLEIFKKFDKIAFMNKGKLVYYGPAYPDALKFFNFDLPPEEFMATPDSALAGLVRNETRGVDFSDRFQESPYYDDLCKEETCEGIEQKPKDEEKTSNWVTQLTTLFRRNSKLKIRDKVNTIMLVAQAPIIALLISSVFYFGQPPHLVPLFLMVIASLWFGTTNAVREIVGETTILRYELRNGLNTSAYVLSKFLILSALCAFQCICMVILVNYFLELSLNKMSLCVILFVASLTGLGIGLLISAMSKNQQRAISIIPLVLIPMVVLGGGMINVSNMDKWSVATASVMPSRWAYELVVHIVDDHVIGQGGNKGQAYIKAMYGNDSYEYNTIIVILGAMILLSIIGVILTIRSRSSRAMA